MDAIGSRSNQRTPETKIDTIVATRYVCEIPCRGPPRFRKSTKNGSISRITLHMRIVAKSKNGKSITPVSRAGPKWYGVNGMGVQNTSRNQVAINLMTLVSMTMLYIEHETVIGRGYETKARQIRESRIKTNST